MWPMTKCLRNRICHFVFASLSKVYLRQIHKYKTSFNAISIGRAGKCADDDDDDSGGRTQRDCLRLTAPCFKGPKPRQRQIQFVFANKYFSRKIDWISFEIFLHF